mmetsp:Transcript_98929/g.282966  ORF Transcript_98929/g.282966 Transcript_98929/m.282966 type:complete len:237 (-) Transcript_98929:17-727(-)
MRRLYVLALDALRFGVRQRDHERANVLRKRLVGERHLPDARVHDSVLLCSVLHLATLELLYAHCHVLGHRSELWIRHQLARAEDPGHARYDRHHFGSRDAAVELDDPLLDLLYKVLAAHHVRPRLARRVGVGVLREDGHPHRFPGAVRQLRGSPHGLVRLARVDAQLHGELHRFVELGPAAALDVRNGRGDAELLAAPRGAREAGRDREAARRRARRRSEGRGPRQGGARRGARAQ